MNKKILVLAEHFEGKIKPASWEAIGFGQRLAEQHNFGICGVILGDDVENLASQISEKSGVEVLSVSDERCFNYTPEVYCDLFLQIIRRESPFLVIMGHTYQTIDFGPRLAMMLDRAFIPNCIDFQIAADRLVFTRVVYRGKLIMQAAPKGQPPHLFSVQPGRFSAKELQSTGMPKVIKLDMHVTEKLIVERKVLEVVQEVQDKIDLSQAEVIVAGGRGLGSKDNFQIIVDLAKAWGASVGATRPVIDSGWLPKGHQIGSSGQSVTPRLYVACGISGAPKHLVGIINAETIIAVNKDPFAPIFGVADYGIVGDVFRIVPALTSLVKRDKRGRLGY